VAWAGYTNITFLSAQTERIIVMISFRQLLVCFFVITFISLGGLSCGGDDAEFEKETAEVDNSPEAAEARSEMMLNQNPATLNTPADQSTGAPQTQSQ
jgi:hypothetical protein